MRFSSTVVRAGLVIALALIGALGVSRRGSAALIGGERVTFKSADASVNALIPATVFRPPGASPYPGLVTLHGCSGINEREDDWVPWLQTQGYMVVVPDSLAPRGLATTCDSNALTMRAQALDGLGALAYLRSRPDVIATKIGVMGWSHGGGAALISAAPRFIHTNHPEGGGYQAAIAIYPVCDVFPEFLANPLLVLLGSADNWARPTKCIQQGTALQAAGAQITLKVYPGATHSFDVPLPDRTAKVAGGTVQLRYDPAAAADARAQVQSFLKTHLQ